MNRGFPYTPRIPSQPTGEIPPGSTCVLGTAGPLPNPTQDTCSDEDSGFNSHPGENCPPPEFGVSGACCLLDGQCRVTSEPECFLEGGTYQGDDIECEEVSCDDPVGACCLPDGTCEILTEAICGGIGGTYFGDETDCVEASCPPAGACCLPDGSCVMLTETACLAASGTYQGDEVDCDEDPCDPVGACCLPSGECALMTEDACLLAEGTYQGDDTLCEEAPCAPTGACCLPNGTCEILSEAECTTAEGIYFGDDTECDDDAPRRAQILQDNPIGYWTFDNTQSGSGWVYGSYVTVLQTEDLSSNNRPATIYNDPLNRSITPGPYTDFGPPVMPSDSTASRTILHLPYEITNTPPVIYVGDYPANLDGNGDTDYTKNQIYTNDSNNQWTIEAWVRFNDNDSGIYDIKPIINLATMLPHPKSMHLYGMYLLYHAPFNFYTLESYFFTDSVSYPTISESTYLGVISPNTEFHLVAVYDGTHTRNYVNGIEASSTSWNATLDFSGESVFPIAIGCGFTPYHYEYCFPGDIDEVALYDHALSAERVCKHYSGCTCEEEE